MSSQNDVRSGYTRRSFLETTLKIASAASAGQLLSASTEVGNKSVESKIRTYNGGADPYPIPWLDKNGSHNQPAGPQLEPSHIYHFKGQVGRCADFVGMGTERLSFDQPNAHPPMAGDIINPWFGKALLSVAGSQCGGQWRFFFMNGGQSDAWVGFTKR